MNEHIARPREITSTEKNKTLVSYVAHDDASFESEQSRLRFEWTFVGLLADVAKEGDWIQAELWGRSIFIQRFAMGLRGFENQCLHRLFPLRRDGRGSGPIRCEFHGWLYNEEGMVVGIPMCRELFECDPKDFRAHLHPVDVAICGGLIFARWPCVTDGGSRKVESLEGFLGDLHPILSSITTAVKPLWRVTAEVKADWKFCFHVSLDDYHIVSVHKDTLGANGHLRPGKYRYFRIGKHSAMFVGADCGIESLQTMRKVCVDGSYEAEGYRVFHIFPNLTVLQTRFNDRWYVVVTQYSSAARGHSRLRGWICRAGFVERTPFQRGADLILGGVRDMFLWAIVRKILREDNVVAERLQTAAQRVPAPVWLGVQEERIAWFDEAYCDVMSLN